MRIAIVGLVGLVAACSATPSPPVTLMKVRDVPATCEITYRDKAAERTARTRLARDLTRYVSRQPGRVAFAAHDLVTGVTFGHREHENGMITASGSKVDILTALMLRRDRLGEYERDLATRMIRESDNRAADALWWRVGGGYGMGRFYRQAGLRETVPGPSRFWGGTNTSPFDRIRLLKLLARGGKGLTAGDRSLILSLMGRVVPDQAWGVSAAARPGDTVALKNGWTPRPFIHNTWAVTSYGRITGPGRDLLLAVQTDLQSGEGRGIQTIEGLSRLLGHRLDGLRATRTVVCRGRL
ncbi:serine hydrolase [Nonomuraea sp. NPDC050663]|uniref:serine hydrolase n=1 Tax=Nonomuraea sp. NPDC050663 TaxID=3364370 RepID=UPI0037B8444D